MRSRYKKDSSWSGVFGALGFLKALQLDCVYDLGGLKPKKGGRNGTLGLTHSLIYQVEDSPVWRLYLDLRIGVNILKCSWSEKNDRSSLVALVDNLVGFGR